MRILPFLRGAAAAAAGAAASIGLAAAATAAPGPIPINPGNVPTTAAAYQQECSDNLGGGPYPGKDVWVFNLPGNAATTGSFTSITAAFDTDGDGKSDTTVVIDPGAGDGDDIVMLGTSKAYAITVAGWTLVGATATITGTADKFVLTHTCAAEGGSTTPPTTKPTSGTPTTATTTSPATPATTSPTGPATATSAAGPGTGGGSGNGTAGGLPITGANATGAAGLGLALIGGGTLLVLRRRRRFVA